MALTWRFRSVAWGVATLVISTGLLANGLANEADFGVRLLSESHTLWSLLLCYRTHEKERYSASSVMARMKRSWQHPQEAQENLLLKLIARDAKTEYGRTNRLREIRSISDLRTKHPITNYDHFKKYIDRLDGGDIGAFTGERPSRFGVTSGTTGVGKLIPYGAFFKEGDVTGGTLARLAVYRCSSRPSPLQKRCFLYTHSKREVSKSGLSIGPYSLITNMASMPVADHTSPPPAFAITDTHVATYIHMLFAMADLNLCLISSMYAPTMHRAFKLLQDNWPAMLEDLTVGRINDSIPLAVEVRRSLEGYMVSNPGRVAQLRAEFKKGFDGIARRIWPHLIAVDAVDILGCKQRIEETYGQGVLYSSAGFGCTEVGTFGVNMDVNQRVPSYVFRTTQAIMEFIPETEIFEEQPRTLLLNEVQIGQNYELIVTTLTGLYRYRYGDVIQVVGFYENTPLFRLKYRTDDLLNVASEKTNTTVMTSALKMAVESWHGAQLVNWTSTDSAIYDPGTSDLYYVLFVEIASTDITISAEQKLKFDECLQLCHDRYKSYRGGGTISVARVHVVSPGTFTALRDYTVSKTTASVNQYKTPRKMRTREQMEWIMSRVTYSSNKT